jgi:molybdopterin molybdotransferase
MNPLPTAIAAETLIHDLVANTLGPLHPQDDREIVPLSQALGRILAQTLTSPLDFPLWDNSAMDGYGVRWQDVADCSPQQPVTLPVAFTVAAGQAPPQALPPGQAVRIFTGAMLPPGADTVIMQERAEFQELPPDVSGDGNPDDPQPLGRVTFRQAPPQGNFVRQRGEFCPVGGQLLAAGVRIQAAELAILAAAQQTQIPVYRPVRVGLFSTGDELVPPDRPLAPGQIVDSNRYGLAALLQQAGAIVQDWGIVPDDRPTLAQTLTQALTAPLPPDVILSSGGVSVGDYDYIDGLIRELGGTIHLDAVAIKPGKPLTVATFPAGIPGGRPCLYFGLPGNPVSALVSFWRFVQPALGHLGGVAMGYGCRWLWGTAGADLVSGGDRETYLWGQVTSSPGQGLRFTPAPGGHSSGNLINLGGTNALAKIPVGTRHLGAGTPVELLLLG